MPAFSEELDRYEARKILVYLRRLEDKEENDDEEDQEEKDGVPPTPAEDENRSAQEVK